MAYRIYTNRPLFDEPEYGEDVSGETIYPPYSTIRYSIDPADFHIPEDVNKLYMESRIAIENSMYLAAAILIRALVEAICKHQEIASGNLEKKIDKLWENGILAKRQSEILHKLRALGNYAAHEFIVPSSADVVAAFEIAEIVIKTIYELPEKSKGIMLPKES